MRKRVPGLLLATLAGIGTARVAAQFPPAPGTGPGLAETIEAIDSARVTTRILYVTAHPDDESSAVLTYLARGLHADVALLSLTRGEGGQNALGPEQAPQLGLIRTQELLAATRGYGVKLYFTRAKDFGFSKTPEETEKIWGDQVLEDMVRVIRTFRPNIVINNFGGVRGGHGHHQVAGLWTPKAVAMAADAKAFPDQLKEGLSVWGDTKNAVQVLDVDRFSEKPTGTILPVDEVSPLWGKTWREIGIDAFANHRTQGVSVFLGSPFFRRPIALKREDGAAFDAASLAVSLRDWARLVLLTQCSGTGPACSIRDAGRADEKIAAARTAALDLDYKTASAELAEAALVLRQISVSAGQGTGAKGMFSADQLFTLSNMEARLDRALRLTAGLQLTANASRNNLVAGETVDIRASAHCRPEVNCGLGRIVPADLDLAVPNVLKETRREKDAPEDTVFTANANEKPIRGREPMMVELPEQAIAGAVTEEVTIAGYKMSVALPVTYIAADSTHVARVPLRIVPAYTLAVEPQQVIEALANQHKPFDVFLRVHSYSAKAAEVTVGLDSPKGWTASAPVKVKFDGEGDRYVKLTTTPPVKLAAGDYTITPYANRGEEKFSTSIEPLPSMPTLQWEEPAKCVVHAFNITVPENLRVGYVTAEREPVPEALRMLGIRVEMLEPEALAFGDLSKYDAIVVGVRAYELRGDLPGANQRLLDYVSNGGTLVVQYERDFVWDKTQYAPYPAKIGNPTPRITDENSPVRFLKPEDPLLNRPNKITTDDFKGWVQERGLYFWSQFDPKYTPLLAMNDPAEKDLDGGLVYTKYGKGTYIYTGIAFFRQLPEGVSGAYRLFVNLLSASRAR